MLKHIWITLNILILTINVYSQENYVFEHFSIPEGLSNPTVFSVLQDSYGFLWVGTADGVNRYDGYDFKVYKNDPADSLSLPGGGEIWAICEDKNRNLWIGGQSFLVLYDRINDNFKQVVLDISYYATPAPLIYSILSDSKNRIWVATKGHGVHLINPETLKTEYQKLVIEGEEKRMNMNFSTMETHSGEILVPDMANGILKFNENKNAFELYNIPGITKKNLILKILEDEMNNLWLANWQGKLQRYNPAERSLETIDIYKSVKMQSSDPSVVEIFKDQNGFIWFGTFTNGLIRYNPVTTEFVHFNSNLLNPNSIHGNEISSVVQDQFGILWIGTFTTGLNKVDPKKQPFNVYRLPKELRKNTRDDAITSIYKSSDSDDIWLGTFGSGLVRVNPANNDFTNYTSDPNSSNPIGSSRITCITGEGKDNIWIGTDISLNNLNLSTGQIKEYLKGETTPGQQYQINDVKVDNTGRIYVANTNGIEILYPLHNQVNRVSTTDNRRIDNKIVDNLKALIKNNAVASPITTVSVPSIPTLKS